MARPVEFEQVQGILRFGYRKLTECSFFLLVIKDPQAARQWLANAPVTNALPLADAPDTALQVALTSSGLRRLGCPSNVLTQFSHEFQSGMAVESRARLLGDTGESEPGHWQWGSANKNVDVLLMLYARPGKLADWKRDLNTPLWEQAFSTVTELKTADLGGLEPFGFPDGLSQPELDWERQRVAPSIEDTYTNRIALGEFLLGYPNEYNRYTDRPLVSKNSFGADLLPDAEDQDEQCDFGRNGSYLVLRTLKQDVEGFWTFARSQSVNEEAAQSLAAAMVGRHKDGSPLAESEASTASDVSAADRMNRFNFSGDPAGTRCPLGAHIRRVNPRNGDLPWPPASGLRRLLTLLGLQPKTLHSDAKASSRFHRVLRRGREYGGAPAADGPTGLHFVCLVANIARQFEFLQSAWIASTKFDAMTDESDPLLGSREPLPGAPPTDTFTIPQADTAPDTLHGVPRFVHVCGGSYFFLPSIAALRFLTVISECERLDRSTPVEGRSGGE